VAGFWKKGVLLSFLDDKPLLPFGIVWKRCQLAFAWEIMLFAWAGNLCYLREVETLLWGSSVVCMLSVLYPLGGACVGENA